MQSAELASRVALAPRWRPAAAYRLSALVHAAGLGAVAAQPSIWPLAAGAIGCNHALLALAGFLPRSSTFGPNLSRLGPDAVLRGQIAITFDDGPDPQTTPRVLDRLARAGMHASFFCVGERVLAHPLLAREIVRAGHSIENHSHRHCTSFGWSGWRRLHDEVGCAQRAISDTVGVAPSYFRAPFGIRNPLLEPVLARSGLRYASWTRRGFDTTTRSAERIAHRLIDQLDAGDILLLHDGVATGQRDDAGPMLDALDRVIDAATRTRLVSVSLPSAIDHADV